MLTDERILEIAEAYGDMAGEYRKISFARAIQEEAYKAGMAAAVPDGWRVVSADALNRWMAAFAEELAAWDIDPPIHHVKTSHDEIAATLSASPEVK